MTPIGLRSFLDRKQFVELLYKGSTKMEPRSKLIMVVQSFCCMQKKSKCDVSSAVQDFIQPHGTHFYHKDREISSTLPQLV